MPNKCRYAKKKKNILKGYFWCSKYKKVVKNCRCWQYKPNLFKSLFY